VAFTRALQKQGKGSCKRCEDWRRNEGSIQWNAILGSYYHKKRAEGHPHKWAIVPTMRKLLSLLNRIARDPGFIPMPEPESTKQNANVGRKKAA